MPSDPVSEAIALIRAGKRAKAQEILEPFIEANPHHVEAWLWEAQTWPTVETKSKVLALGLQHNPDNPQLQEALAAITPQPAKPTTTSVSTQASVKTLRPPQPQTLAWRLVSIALVACALGGLAFAGFWLAAHHTNCDGFQNAKSTLHILFIGNSYTAANDLTGMFTQLACSGGHRVEAAMAAEGGWTIANHLASSETMGKLSGQKWNFVVLQEQSQTPATEYGRRQVMYPAVRQMVSKINAVGAKPILFMTWGHRDGWPDGGLQNYTDMQTQLFVGYLGIAKELNVPVAPAGYAWFEARRLNPQVNLWQDDGSHPNEAGTYLAACVFYATLFQQSPKGLPYSASLSPETAQTLQALAADTVLTESGRWNLPITEKITP